MKPYQNIVNLVVAAFSRGAATVIRLAVMALALGGLTQRLPAQTTNTNFQVLQAAADTGDAKAQYELANYYEKVGSDRKAAEFWLKSAEQGYARAQAAIGSAYGRGVGEPMDISKAVAWYRKSAEQGYAAAEFVMGNFYADGNGVSKDLAQAVQWWEKSAAQNYASAEESLGELLVFPRNEDGTNYVNHTKGIEWLRRAAAHGSISAMNNLGLAYETGTGVKHDEQKMVHWYREAAERGEATAQASMGECYFAGRGVPLDRVEAYKWFKLSAMQGCFLGIKGMSYFSSAPLKPKEIGEAEQRALDFHAKTDTNYPDPVQLELEAITNSPAVKSP